MTEASWPPGTGPEAEEVRRVAEQLRLGDRYRELDRSPEFPRAEFRALGRAGLLGLTVPTALGGRGLSPARAATVLAHLGYLGGTAFAKLSLQPEFSSVLAEHGSPELVDRWFRPLVRGELLVGNQITEPSAGSDASALELTAEPVGEGYRLSGTKSELAFAIDADAGLVYARLPGTRRAEGVTAFLVPQDLPGVRRSADALDLGERWQRRGHVVYDRVEVARGLRIGDEGAAFGYLRSELSRERGLLAAIYLGVARASWEETVRYVGERTAFGRRLADQQAVAFPLVEDEAELEASWLYTVRALDLLERGEDASAETAVAKVRATRAALATLEHAIQFHGGAGYSARYPHEQRWRDVRSGSIAHGASEVLLGIAARRRWPSPRR
jgi:cyclohexanecarboxyl-CoA dehydrogenase